MVITYPLAGAQLADYASNPNSPYYITLVGHTSLTGDTDKNNELARRRIEAVKNYLVSQGASPSRILTQVVGAGNHADKNTNDDGTHSESNAESERQNRSVTVRLYRR